MPSDDIDGGEVLDAEAVSESGRVPAGRVQFTVQEFRGPLPHPGVLREYDTVVPGLAREIVDQWKGETSHRHKTIDALRETDNEASRAFYRAELIGQVIAGILFLGILAVVAYAIAEHQTAIGVAGVVAAGGSVIWAIRRRSGGPSTPPKAEVVQLDSGDEVEKPPA